MRTVPEILRWRARQHPELCALRHRGRERSYAELDRGASRAANALLGCDLQPGERVCFLDKTHDDAVEALFAIGKAGGVFTPVNWRLAPPEIAYVVNDARAPVLLAGEEYRAVVEEIRPQLEHVRHVRFFGDGDDPADSYSAWRDASGDDDPRCDTPEAETVWQLYTSGTTGHPKGAELTHGNLLTAMASAVQGFGGFRPGEVALVSAPFYHIGGAGYALSGAMGGLTLVLTREFVPSEILKLIGEHRINYTFWVPAMMLFLLQHPECGNADFSSLKAILYGASPIPEGLLKRAIETFGCEFIQAYGLTETTGAITLLPGSEHVPGSPRLRSCGKPVFGEQVRVVDEAGREAPPGTVGEIQMRGALVMKGYWGRSEDTAQAIGADGWFRSGDAGYFDEDGFLYIHDRVKDMVVSGGENIYPAEVESVLFAHPGVADVAVIGVPDERWGESVKAVVVCAEGASPSEKELLDYCEGKLAGYKRPRSVDFVDSLPRNPTGKLLKRELREPYWAGKERRVN